MEEPSLDDELVQDYLAECREHLATIDIDVLALEEAGTEFDERTVNRIFRAAHSIKGGAGVCGLVKIRDLAHQLEDALDLIRTRRMQPTTDVTSVRCWASTRSASFSATTGKAIRPIPASSPPRSPP